MRVELEVFFFGFLCGKWRCRGFLIWMSLVIRRYALLFPFKQFMAFFARRVYIHLSISHKQASKSQRPQTIFHNRHNLAFLS